MSTQRVITELQKLVSSDSNFSFFPRLSAMFGVWTDEFTEEFVASIDVDEFAQSLIAFSEGVNDFERLDAMQRDKLDDDLYQCILHGINSRSDEVGNRVDDAFDDDRFIGSGILSPEFGESLDTLCVEVGIRGQEFDDRRQNALYSEEMRKGKEPIAKDKPADPIDMIVQKGALHGKDSWTSGELQQLKDYSTAELKLKLKEEAKEAVERIARKLFPELSTAERVTADQLTECFQVASNQNPSEFESMDRKLQYRDLVKAFRESGGTVELAGQAVRMDLVKPDGAASKAFRTMHAKKGVQGAKIHWGPPPLKFSHNPIDG